MIKSHTVFDFSLVGTAPVCLPQPGQTWEPGTTVTVSGWGALSYGGSSPDILQTVDMPLISNDECRSYYGATITDDMICAYEYGKDSCQGDSGGPLTAVNPTTNRVELVGIVSFGIACGVYPGVYCNVATQMDFIKAVVAAEGQGGCIPV